MIRRIKELFERATKSRIMRDSSALLVANYSALGLSMVASIVLARTLGPDNLGLVYLGITVVNTIVQFMDIRTSEALIRFMGNALARDDHREAQSFFLVGLSVDTVLMLATLALTLLAAPLVSGLLKNPDSVRHLTAIYVFTIPFDTLENTFSANLNVFKQFNLRAVGTILIGLVRLTVLLIAAKSGVDAVMWAYVAASAFSFLVWFSMGLWLYVKNISRVARQAAPLRRADYKNAWRQFLPFAFHTSLTQSLKAISSNIDMLVLGALRPPGEVAFFRIANSAANLITMPTAPVSMVIYPELNEAWAKENFARIRRLIRQFALLSLVAGGVAWLVLSAASHWLVILFYGLDFLPVAPLIVLIGVGIVIESTLRWVRPTALAQNKPQLVTFYGVITVVLRIGLILPLVYYFGATGAAAAYVSVVFVTIGLVFFYVMPRLGLRGVLPEQST